MYNQSSRKSTTRHPPVTITVSPNTPSPEWSSAEDDEGPHSASSSSEPAQSSMSSKPNSNANSRSPSAKSWVDYAVPKCVDFGIQDFLCRMDEEFDCSDDTDTSYLDATPPHRFSDGEVERIDPLPVILNSILKDEVYMESRQNDCISSNSAFTKNNKSPSNSSLIIFHVPSPAAPTTTTTTTSEPSKTRNNRPRPFRRNFSLPAALFTSRLASNRVDPLKIDNVVVSSSATRKGRADFTANGSASSAAASTSSTISGVTFLPEWESLETPQESDTSIASAVNAAQLCQQASDWSLDEIDDFGDSDDSSAFTTDIEQKSIKLRSRRRLVRQDTTTGNVAPADFHI